ncbi:ion channel [Bacillaceae bacterium S4-13-58]
MYIINKIGLQLLKMKNLTIGIVTVVFIALCTITIYFLEPENFESLPNSFYYVMTTFSTVGYGDYSPVTMPGKIFAVFMYLIGIGLLGVVIGKIVDAFNIFRKKREEGKLSYLKENHIVIVGWGKKTEAAVHEILQSDKKKEVVVIAQLEKSPFDLSLERVHFIQGDPTDETTYESANIQDAMSVIVFSDDLIQDSSLQDAKTLSIAITVERVAPKVHTTVEVMTEKHTTNFTHVKVDEFILSQETISSLAVRSAMYIGVSQVYTQLISRQYGENLYKVTRKVEWETYRDAFLDLLQEGATLIADGNRLDINRRLDEKIPETAALYVICSSDVYQKIG